MKFIKKIAIQSIGLMVIALVLPGFTVTSWRIAIVASMILAILNAVIKPFLFILTLPINFLTLGLFSFILNALMLHMTASIVGGGFIISSFGVTFIASILLTIYQRIVDGLFEEKSY